METREARHGVGALEAHLGFWMRRVSNAVSGEFARSLAARHVSVAEWVALCTLADRGAMAPSDLAAAMGMTRGAVSKIAEKLQAKGWVRSQPAKDDGRGQRLSLTRNGVRNLPGLAALADANEEQFFATLTKPERVALRRLLRKVAEANGLRDLPTE